MGGRSSVAEGNHGTDSGHLRFAEELLVDGGRMAGMDPEFKRTKRKKKKRARIAPG
jgi:hypothetical protein